MKKNTRFAFNAYLQQLARLNGVAVEELSSKFTVEPSVQQTLEDQIQQSAAFLTLINVTPVTEQSGQLLGLGVGSTIAGTTDTTAKEREPVDPTLMIDVEYKCEQTNFDTVLTYAKLDLWAKFQDFLVRIRDAIVKLQYQRSWRHAANSRVNRRPSTQFLGPDNDMLTLSGVLMPEITGGRLSLLVLEQMAEQGKAWPLIEGSGTIYGMYVIEGLNQTKTEFFRDGMPRRIEFTLSLKRVDESLSDMFGDLSAHSRYNWRKVGQISTRKCL